MKTANTAKGFKLEVFGTRALLFQYRHLLLIIISLMMYSTLCCTIPSVDEYLSGIPSFDAARNDDISHGNFMVTGCGLVVINVSSEGADVSDVIHYRAIRFNLDENDFAYKETRINFGDGTSIGVVDMSDHYIDHEYPNTIGSYSVTVEIYNIHGQHESDIYFSIRVVPVQNTQLSSVNDNGDKITYMLSQTNQSIKKPLLIIEGYALYGSTSASSVINMNPNFFYSLLYNGYDVFILTFGNNQGSMITNSQAVLGAINAIYGLYTRNNEPIAGEGATLMPIKIIGYSMGGVLARIALDYAEAGNASHLCNTMFTIDSPHRGILLNENMQNKLQGTLADILLPSEIEDLIDSALTSSAAKQLIRNNVRAQNHSVEIGSDNYREIYSHLNTTDSYGVPLLNDTGYPHKQNMIKKYAISLGSRSAVGNTINASQFCNFYVRAKLGGVKPTLNVSDIDAVWYDTAPASLLPLKSYYVAKICEHNWDDFLDSLLGTPQLQFIFSCSYIPPMVTTISSLGIESIPFTNGNLNVALPSVFTTPFDEYYIANTPQYHTIIPNDVANWVINKLNSIDASNNSHEIGYARGVMSCPTGPVANVNVTIRNVATNEEYSTVTNNIGEYSFPLYYITPCDYELSFNSPVHYPAQQTLRILPNYLGDFEIPELQLYTPEINNIVVSNDESSLYHTVSQALGLVYEVANSPSYQNESFRIIVKPGTYIENPVVKIPSSGIQSLTIMGGADQPQIVGAYQTGLVKRVLTVDNDGNHPLGSLILKNLTFAGGSLAGGIMLYNNIGGAEIINCTIKDFQVPSGFQYQVDTPYYDGTAIKSECPTIIRNCKIYNNQGYYDSSSVVGIDNEGYDSPYNSHGIIYITESSAIDQCKIYDNAASIAGAIYVNGNDCIIRDNQIFGNQSLCPSSETIAVWCRNSSGVQLLNNTFYDNYGAQDNDVPGAVLRFYNCGSSIVRNNTFTNTLTGYSGDLAAIRVKGDTILEIYNNVIMNYPLALWNTSNLTTTNAMLRNNLFWNNTTNFAGIQYDMSSNPGNCLFVDPKLSSDNTPMWDVTTMSPCIDNGTGYKDPDGTPADIGAVTAIAHDSWRYGFRDATAQDPQLPIPKDTWHWVSYPVVNTLTTGKTIANQYFSALLGTHQTAPNVYVPDVLQEIIWMENGEPERIALESGSWGSYYTTHSVTSPQGYKIKLLPGYPNQANQTPVTLSHSGYRTPANTAFNIIGSPNPANVIYENWIGYFDKDSAMPNTAFASIWNDIIFVQGKSWSLYRDESGDLVGTMGALNDGDMVIIATYINHDSFRWVNNTPIPPHKKSISKAFDFNELPDYKPVYLDLSEIDTADLKEIGLYLDGECKGAVVVEDSLEMICAYLEDDESLEVGDVELEFVYESKSNPRLMQAMPISSSNLIKTNVGSLPQYPVYHINVKNSNSNNMVIPLSLERNYPNPFNPETTIRYSIDEPGMVALEIYNLKGQLVKTLAKGITDAGRYSAIWNGTDNNGKPCASGVYLYKLNTKNKTMVQKMLMLK